jgi:hypothetical protein
MIRNDWLREGKKWKHETNEVSLFEDDYEEEDEE